MDARTSDSENRRWMLRTIERTEEEKRSLYDVDLPEPRVAWSRYLPLIEFEDGTLRLTRRLR